LGDVLKNERFVKVTFRFFTLYPVLEKTSHVTRNIMDACDIFISNVQKFNNKEVFLVGQREPITPFCVIHANIDLGEIPRYVGAEGGTQAGAKARFYAPPNMNALCSTPLSRWWALRAVMNGNNKGMISDKWPVTHCLNGIPRSVKLLPAGLFANPGKDDMKIGVVQVGGTVTAMNTGGLEIETGQKVMLVPIAYIDFELLFKNNEYKKLMVVSKSMSNFSKIPGGGVAPLNDLYLPMTIPYPVDLCASQAANIEAAIIHKLSRGVDRRMEQMRELLLEHNLMLNVSNTFDMNIPEYLNNDVRQFLEAYMTKSFTTLPQPCSVHLAVYALCKNTQLIMGVIMQDPVSNLSITPFHLIPDLCERVKQSAIQGLGATQLSQQIDRAKKLFAFTEKIVSAYLTTVFKWTQKTLIGGKVAYRDAEARMMTTFDCVCSLALSNHDSSLREYIVGTALTRGAPGREFDIDLRIGW
jgi:hypothetical protein